MSVSEESGEKNKTGKKTENARGSAVREHCSLKQRNQGRPHGVGGV